MNLRNKRVLVTGAGGFIASHLVERLLGDGASVKALVRYNSLGSWGWLQGHQETASQEDLEILSGDIRDPKFVAVSGIVEHTAHHRGSLSTYTRLCGKVPPMPYMEVEPSNS